MKFWERLLQAIGAISILLSVKGFYFLVDGFRREILHPSNSPEAPFFRQVFFVMNGVNAAFLIVMILTAFALLMLRRNAVRVYTWLYVTLFLYLFGFGALWTIRGPIGISIAAASGVGDMGVAPLLFIPVPFAFPILSVFLLNLALRRLRPSREVPATIGAH
jgi:hypothetical protein